MGARVQTRARIVTVVVGAATPPARAAMRSAVTGQLAAATGPGATGIVIVAVIEIVAASSR